LHQDEPHASNGRSRSKPDRRVDPETLSKLFDRLPPHAPDAEMALLGSLILDPSVTTDVMSLLSTPDQFYSASHALIYKTLVETYDRHRSGDLVQLTQALRDAGALDDVGGEDYLVRLADTVPSAANAVHYARIISDKARLRKLVDAAGTAIYEAYNAGDANAEGVTEILDRAEMAIFEVAQDHQSSDPQLLKHLLDLEIERLDQIGADGFAGLPTGFYDLDRMLRGLHPGEMVIIAARPSMGKTALALNLAEQLAMGGHAPDSSGTRHGPRTPVAIFSLEMSKAALTQRLLSAHSGVSGTKFRDGSLSEREFQRIIESCSTLSEAPIYIDDTPGLTVMQLRARARRMAAQHSIKAVMIDYLQLLTAPGAARESRQVEVSAISRQVKALARELDLPIVCLSQLNRASESREGNRPRMSDLRESGSLEQDADVVALLHREDYYHVSDPSWAQENPDKVGLAELIIAKQRNGPTGTVRFTWNADLTRFQNRAEHHDDEQYHPPTPPHLDPSPHSPNHPAPPHSHEPKPHRGTFTTRPPTGPVDNFRDGGGPADADDTGGVPF